MADLPNENIQPLARVRIYEGLDLGALEIVVAAAHRMEKEPDANFFIQGQKASKFFIVVSGRVKVTQVTPEGHQIVVRYAGAGEMFGCVPLFGGDEYPATATAVTRCRAMTWNRAAVDRLMEQFPRIAINALGLLGKELGGLRARYRELATERVERRIARALVRLVGQAGRKVEDGVLIEFPISRQDLAELTGTTLHTVSRILSAWEQQGIVRSGRRRIVVCSPHGLVSIAEDLNPPRDRMA